MDVNHNVCVALTGWRLYRLLAGTIGNDGVTEVVRFFNSGFGLAFARFHGLGFWLGPIAFSDFSRVACIATTEELEVAHLEIGEVVVSDDCGHAFSADVP